MVELMITSAVLVVLLGMVLLSMNLIQGINASVSAQYQEFDQVVPALAPIRSLIASEVEPAPVTGGIPTPAFQQLGNFAATWTANIGTQHGNVVGNNAACATSCTAGPAQIVAEELDSSNNPVTSTQAGPNTKCTSLSPCSFQVRMYLPRLSTSAPGYSTCPVPINGTTGGTCQWSSNYILVANIQDVVNNPQTVDASGNPTTSIFTYTLVDATTATTFQLTPAMLNQSPQTITGLPTPPYSASSQSLSACTGTAGLLCPMDAVQSVTIHLIVAKPGAGTNGAVENQIVNYRYPISTNADCYPFQYSDDCDPYVS